jgi:hypothetical protein
MPTFSENGKNSYTAAATVAQGTIVKFSGSTDAAGLPTVTPTTAANDAAIGIALMPANAGEKVAVKILGSGGTTLVIAGGAVTVGAQVAADGTATAADTDVIIGRALSAASAANELIEVVTQVGMVK